MNYVEEQQSELEAIEAIYPNEFTLISDSPIEFTIVVKSDTYEEDGEGLCCSLKFAFSKKYPDEVPTIEIVEEDEENKDEDIIMTLDPPDVIELKELLIQQASENIGMAMVFTIVSAAIEWLNNRWDSILKEREDAAEKKRREEEEAEHQRFEGTRVTVQTFIAWKSQFDEERLALKNKASTLKDKEKDSDKKLTGKELFMIDKTLIESDLQFLEDGDDAGPIDESLFEDLEDLDIGDEEN